MHFIPNCLRMAASSKPRGAGATKLQHKDGNATKHAEESVNVVFINIDWKKSRMEGRGVLKEMRLLGDTIKGVVRCMNPTMICMCEVGGTQQPLSEGQMRQVVDKVEWAWNCLLYTSDAADE